MLYSLAVTFSGHYDGLAAYGFFLLLMIILFAVLGLVLLPAMVVAGLARRQAEHIRNQRVSTVIAQYDPPRDLTPAEMGLLYDMRCGQPEILATLFSLEQRHIIEVMDDQTVRVIKQAAYKDLPEYEKIAIRLFNGETEDLRSTQAAAVKISYPGAEDYKLFSLPTPAKQSRQAFSAAVQQSVESKGIHMRNYGGAFAIRVIGLTLLFGLLPMLTAGWSGTFNGVSYGPWSVHAFGTAFLTTLLFGFFLLPVYILTASLLVLTWTKIAGRYWLNTKQARAVWPELEGYKLYLEQVDLDNIQFESTTKGQNPLTDTFPYALVFGLDTKWQVRLKNRLL